VSQRRKSRCSSGGKQADPEGLIEGKEQGPPAEWSMDGLGPGPSLEKKEFSLEMAFW